MKNLNPLICRFYFLDGKAKAMGVNPSATASDVIRALAEKIELQNVDGWALYEVQGQLCSISAVNNNDDLYLICQAIFSYNRLILRKSTSSKVMSTSLTFCLSGRGTSGRP